MKKTAFNTEGGFIPTILLTNEDLKKLIRF